MTTKKTTKSTSKTKKVKIDSVKDSYLTILLSDDVYLIDNYIKTNFSEYKLVSCDNLLSHKNEFYTRSFLVNSSKSKNCYLIRHNEAELNTTLIENVDDLVSGKYQNYNKVVYVFSSIDKRSKLYKSYSSIIVEPTASIKSVAKDILGHDANDTVLAQLYTTCNESMSRYTNELNKAYYLAKSGPSDINQCISDLIQSSLSNKDIDTFKLIDAIISKDINKVNEYLKCIDRTKFDFGLLTLLYNNYHNIFVVKDAGSAANQQSTGLNSYIINSVKKYCSMYSKKCLNNILKILYNIDKGIKNGLLETELAYDYMIVRIWNCEN